MTQPHYHGHRQRLKDKFLNSPSESFPDYELMELFLFLLNPRRDVKPDAKKAIEQYGNIARIFALSSQDLSKLPGITPHSTVYFKLFKEIATRINKSALESKPIINTHEVLIEYLRGAIGHNATENFAILYLDKKNMLIYTEIIEYGTIDQTNIYPREIMKNALALNATALIIAHNHPSNNIQPSKADITLTNILKKITSSLNITLHDHVIITSESFFSFKQNNLL
ncbi:RadC family protein [Rickettsiales endosymbiont of Stachyamoeba lipophora]|uniref:RadC family protein n=1 Tax=Rickettsiales endosymbiont of Stachyamoeba lipophora TaxID=2486578 RepID=UPI000F648620|nr:DNA repair protein RadC [Rickettsiales endosymbiont of Stachyamoeba lipophora]AZL15410.1 DNA repair protein RadC [Rickettsiales endosymbiont of Stachyamoeba lipophora]